MANCFVKVRILLSQLIPGEYKARITKVVLAFAICVVASSELYYFKTIHFLFFQMNNNP